VEVESPESRAERRRSAGRLLVLMIGAAGLTAGTAWLGALFRVGRPSGSAFLFLLCFIVGLVAAFQTVQSAFRLGRSMRSGYDPDARADPSSNLLWESVKSVWGLGMFVLKAALGFVLWAVLLVLFERV
jgi:cation transporter-like permease